MKLKSIILVFTLFLIYFIFNSFSYSHSISNNLEENLFRLRVVANSNSKIDQDLKIKVRNSILNYLSKFNLSNKEETILHLKNHQTDIETIISNIIKENGFDYTFQFEISNSFYPAKKYNSITLPSGNYDGLQIKLGNAKGENWWCILFPPMCLINSSTCELEENSNELLSNNLSNETTHIIQSSEPKYKFKFKIIDFINNL